MYIWRRKWLFKDEQNVNEKEAKKELVAHKQDTKLDEGNAGSTLKIEEDRIKHRLRRRVRKLKYPYIVNKDLKENLKNTVLVDHFNPMKLASDDVMVKTDEWLADVAIAL
ncbi:hypothetical protein FNV43_RR11072 [Rhamnella rubrinervis]|uniref:Uncharacterized protein n=1 Tax=Rhamnella rubrinervis TaxID=2594499 RepID=A0A8K0MHI3_9ROSA|nr:hypothetical protein FNV43_RR11072 [Rhamnella rubrinervis]